MIAATRSRPECKASDKTPKLPVRSTRNVLRETRRSADTTLKRAARFFSFTSSTMLAAITVRLDYRTRAGFAGVPGSCAGGDADPCTQFATCLDTNSGVTFLLPVGVQPC